MHLFRLGALVRDEQVHAALAASGQHHAFAQADLHLPRRQIGNADEELADKLLGLVVALDAGKDRPFMVAAETDRELSEDPNLLPC